MSRDINNGSIIADPDNSCPSHVANNPQELSSPTLPFPLQNEQDLARPQVMPIEMARTQGSPKNLKTHTIITIPPTPPPPTSIPTFQTHIRSMPPPNPIPTTFYPTQKTFATKTSQSRRKFTTLPGHPAPIYNPIPQIIPPSQQHLAAATPQSRPMHTIIPIPPSPIFNPIPLNSKPIPQNAPPRATKTQTGPLACPTQSIPVPPTKWLNKNNKVPALSSKVPAHNSTHSGDKGPRKKSEDDGVISSKKNYGKKGKTTSASNKTSQKGKKATVDKENNNKTYQSHPNLSLCKKNGKKDSRELSKITSESDWESEGVSGSEEESNLSDIERECFGPLILAPDPSEKYFNKGKKDKNTHMNPQRHWEPEHVPNSYSSYPNNQQVNYFPERNREESECYQRTNSVRPKTSQGNRPTSQGPKLVEKRSYHISTFGEEGEEVIEEQAVTEDGFQVVHNVSYRKRMKRQKRQRQEMLKNAKDLVSMKRKRPTRFLLTKVNPNLSENSVEAYILRNFDIDEVYVRKNQMRFPDYASFIFITNSEEELDIDEFENHDWPGSIRCFFAPRERNNRD